MSKRCIVYFTFLSDVRILVNFLFYVYKLTIPYYFSGSQCALFFLLTLFQVLHSLYTAMRIMRIRLSHIYFTTYFYYVFKKYRAIIHKYRVLLFYNTKICYRKHYF